jgi:lysozyme family protein
MDARTFTDWIETVFDPAKPAAAADRFPIILPYTLKEECPFPSDWNNPRNFTDNSRDPGGETLCGITNRTFNAWLKLKKLPIADVRTCTQQQGFTLYHDLFWEPECPKMFPGLDMAWFDTDVNEGAPEAVKMLQFALNMPETGVWTPEIEHALGMLDTSVANRVKVVTTFCDRREAVYHQMKGFKDFGAGWEARAGRMKTLSIQMAEGK